MPSTTTAATTSSSASSSSISSSNHNSSNNKIHKWGGRIVFCVFTVWLVTALLLHATLSRLEEEDYQSSYSTFHAHLHAPDLMFLRLGHGHGGGSSVDVKKGDPVASSASSSSLQQQQQQAAKLTMQKQQQQQQPSGRRGAPPRLRKRPDKRQRPPPPQRRKDGGKRITTTTTTTTKSARRVFEETHDPNDWKRIQSAVQSWRVPMPPSKMYISDNGTTSTNTTTTKSWSYDIYNCPTTGPPLDYPYSWPMRQILLDWNPDVTDIPSAQQGIHSSLCVFDWNTDYDTIVTYRKAEVPFIVQNHDDLMRTSERWTSGQTHLHHDHDDGSSNGDGVVDESSNSSNSSSNYLAQLLGSERQRNEYSHSNHFMFWRLDKKQTNKAAKDMFKDWQPPTDNVKLNYMEWYQRAMALEQETLSSINHNNNTHVSLDHWYFRLNGVYGQSHDYLYDELPMFRPDQDPADRNSIFMVDPEEARGINCRFGMKGVIAETHYDPTRNWIVLLSGQRRYILSHPRECPHLHLYPLEHPSGRHSMVDWSNITHNATILKDARGSEVVMQAADALYLPTSWFHFIVSLNINYQCNARSGSTSENAQFITDCGFPAE